MKITGLDDLQRKLDEAGRAFAALDGTIGKISFDPAKPASVRAAIVSMERLVDGKAQPYRTNPLVAQIVPKIKASYRDAILARAASSKTA